MRVRESAGVLLQKTFGGTFVPALDVWISSCRQVLVYQEKPSCLQWHQHTQKSWALKESGCCVRNQWVLGKVGHRHMISKQHSYKDRHWTNGNATVQFALNYCRTIGGTRAVSSNRRMVLYREMPCDVENGSDYSKTSDKETCQYHHHSLGQWR